MHCLRHLLAYTLRSSVRPNFELASIEPLDDQWPPGDALRSLLGSQQVSHTHRLTGVSGEKGSPHGYVLDVTARGVQSRQPLNVQTFGGSRFGKCPSPDFSPLFNFRKREINHEPYATQKGLVQSALAIRGEYGQPAIGLHALQQIADFDIGIAIMTVFDFAAFPKECVGFIEQEHRSAFLGGIKDTAKILFRLANVFVNDLAQVNPIEIKTQLAGKDFGGHGFARAAGSGKQGADPQAARAFGCESPGVVNLGTLANMDSNLAQDVFLPFGQDQIIPTGRRRNTLCQPFKTWTRLHTACVPQTSA